MRYADMRLALLFAEYQTYQEYLGSDHWKNIRALWVASGYPEHCIACDSLSYQLHHLTYKRLGYERLTDLLPLCDRCHGDVHYFTNGTLLPTDQPDIILSRAFRWSSEEVERKLRSIRRCWELVPPRQFEHPTTVHSTQGVC